MNHKIKEIIEYAKSLGLVERTDCPVSVWMPGSTVYSLPELEAESWIIQYQDDEHLMIVKNLYYGCNDKNLPVIRTTNARPYTELNYKFHLKKIIAKAQKMELEIKKHLEKFRLEKMEKDFND